MRNRLPPHLWIHFCLSLLAFGVFLSGGTALAGPFEDGYDFFAAGHYRWALEKFVLAVDQSPRDPLRWWYLAESYRMLGDAEAASTSYRHVLQTAPQSQFGLAARQALEALGEPSITAVTVPFQRRGTAILLPGLINGQDIGAFLLDTGATFISLSKAVAQRLGVRSAGSGTVHLATAGGVIEAPFTVLEEVNVGGAVARYVPAVIHDIPGLPSNVAGLLGMSFLERFRVNLDIASGSIILESGR